MDTAPPKAATAPDPADIQLNKDIAALSYVWILSVVAFFLRRKSPFVQYHARQGMALFVLSILFWTVPFVGKVLELFVLLLGAIGFVFAAQGKWVEVPLVGPLSRGDFKGVRASWKDFVEAAGALAKSLNIPTPTTSAPPPAAPSASPTAPTPAAQQAPTPVVAPVAPAAEPRSSVSLMQAAPPAPPIAPPEPSIPPVPPPPAA